MHVLLNPALRSSTLIITAVVYGVLLLIVSLAGIFGIWLGILVVLSLWRYCYAVVRSFAQGRGDVPPPDFDSMNPVGNLLLVLHFAAFPGIVALLLAYGPVGVVPAILIAGIFPASAGLMGMTESLSTALNPLAIREFIRHLGGDYVLLVLSCAAVVVAALLIDNLILVHLGFLSGLLSMVLGVWALLAVFALIGGTLQARRLDFDIPGERRTEEQYAQAQREKLWQSTLDRAYASLRGGLAEPGYRTLRQFLEENEHSEAAWYWLLEHMFDWEDKRHAIEVARRLLTTEIERGRPGNALELYRRCRRLNAAFVLPAAEAVALAAYASSIGQHGPASELKVQSRS